MLGEDFGPRLFLWVPGELDGSPWSCPAGRFQWPQGAALLRSEGALCSGRIRLRSNDGSRFSGRRQTDHRELAISV